MENKYIPPNKRNRQHKKNGNVVAEPFPQLNNNYIKSNINISRWNNNLKISNDTPNTNYTNYTNKKNKEQLQVILKTQTLNRNKLLNLTIEQHERNKINEELKEESPYWDLKNLLDPDSDNSEEEYDINKHNESGNNSNEDNY
jgi:hypothetical protein